MAAINDITGDAIRSRDSAKYAENYDKIEKVEEEPKVFKVMKCPWCFIKVSTANGKCPCCQRELQEEL